MRPDPAPARPAYAFGLGAVVGTAGGLIGLGGAEFRLPALVGPLGFAARQAVALNLAASFVVLAASFPFRLSATPWAAIAPHAPAVLGMLTGAMTAAWIGAGLLKRLDDRLLGRAILVLLVALGIVLIAEGLFVAKPTRLVGEGWLVPAAVAAACGVVIGLVSSLLGVAGGELIIPVFILMFGVDAKLAGSMSALVGLPAIAIGLTRWFDPGSPLRDRAVLRGTLAPLAAGSAVGAVAGASLLGLVPSAVLKIGLGVILIWSASRIFRHLPGDGYGRAPAGLAARVLAHDADWGLTRYATAAGELTGVAVRAAPGAAVRLVAPPEDVILGLAAPTDAASTLSARNALDGVIEAIRDGTDRASAMVDVATAAGVLTARVTRRSVAEMGLAPGSAVRALVKATTLRAR